MALSKRVPRGTRSLYVTDKPEGQACRLQVAPYLQTRHARCDRNDGRRLDLGDGLAVLAHQGRDIAVDVADLRLGEKLVHLGTQDVGHRPAVHLAAERRDGLEPGSEGDPAAAPGECLGDQHSLVGPHCVMDEHLA